MEVYKRLLEIQQELQAPKGLYNDFGGYAYRSCESILEAVKPLLKKYECIVLLDDTLEYIGNRYYVKASARLVSIDDTSSITVTAYAREEETKKGMDGSQITGASSSYARKYALNGLFAIDDNRDSDATNVGEVKTVKKESTPKANVSDNAGCKCEDCGAEISEKVAKYSKEKIGKELCYKCQQKYKNIGV